MQNKMLLKSCNKMHTLICARKVSIQAGSVEGELTRSCPTRTTRKSLLPLPTTVAKEKV